MITHRVYINIYDKLWKKKQIRLDMLSKFKIIVPIKLYQNHKNKSLTLLNGVSVP